VDIACAQFSQEADLGSSATFNLSLERFSISEDIYTLQVFNLPRQVSYEFVDAETKARVSQIKFTQGVNIKNLNLRTFLPDRDDKDVIIDEPLVFYALVMTREESERLGDVHEKRFSQDELNTIQSGKIRLEFIPRGVGRIEVRAKSLYHEITVGDSLSMDITVRNEGTRRLDNIKITTDNPLNWRSIIKPDLIRSLEPEKEAIVHLAFIPPSDVSVGAQEVKIKTEAMADNRHVQTEDKTVRIQVQSKTPILWTAVLIMLLIGLVLGIVIFGIKISRR